ncbi:ATPase components of ABC transporters with duplicated ATPase domains [Actinopolymorpha cephalotaxi]|uniref:ATPase components of ABC transporters with duplicated ATPase domains n=1 Tax=Actinopolymorpha cephalotaxi TaxID=504797 RepID=A0A1I2WEM3_9ACTN|nr:ATP-binding cassette domain-containing protein [Actinopolymorpha cephalotaxi]NYH82615.1 ATPase subunit of ABC transporter with duplicated ATPase domains [Actinopolymorpha cephalotaxi]SFG99738.1 ATPase components of ABC transporters with duplicated ATPase domains [Actinopolymorpha cephalotaxi]
MGHVDVVNVRYQLLDGRPLLTDVSFRVGEGAKVALVGANGSGKTTLLGIVAGDLEPAAGAVSRSGGLGVMRQFVGTGRGTETVRDLLLSVAQPRIRSAAARLERAELAMMDRDDEPTQVAYAAALAEWADAGGYDAEVVWDICCTEAFGLSFDRASWRPVTTLSGGEQKRLVLQALLRGPDQVLVLDEPDNYLDVPSKRWLEGRLRETDKTVLFVSHDRELLAATAERIVTLEGGREGNAAWVHGGGFRSYHEARLDRHARFGELRRRWDEDRAKLQTLVDTLRAAKSPKTQAAVSRLARFDAAGPPPAPPRRQDIRMRLTGGRTGVRALTCERLALSGLTSAFDLEVFYGERLAVLGANGTGKSHFLRLLAGWPREDAVAHEGTWKLGARVVPGHFSQTHERPELTGRTLLEILWEDHAVALAAAAPALNRYELTAARDQRFETLSGGQQARFQILLLEFGVRRDGVRTPGSVSARPSAGTSAGTRAGDPANLPGGRSGDTPVGTDRAAATMLLLDEPTDNLDVASAEALESAIDSFGGTVVAVTHDRWFARSFDRFVVFSADGTVTEVPEPVWDH